MRALLLAFLLVVSGLPTLAADGVPVYADLLADCAKSPDPACAGQQAALAPQWPKALSGSPLALRNFAFCLADGCYGALKVDPVKACALRIVVAVAMGGDIGAEDRDNFDQACGPLGPEDQDSAKILAREVVRAIRRGGS
ncbi:hypothetical protein [Pleomorphomonas koreensis]|uniref:hypothetical protein n=1 Tax=Pleomorphomonas koreensis TaxID=257440 RepID=UPI0003FC343D|nr:hypothetical protein [Pleomorphomonas koreensis]